MPARSSRCMSSAASCCAASWAAAAAAPGFRAASSSWNSCRQLSRPQPMQTTCRAGSKRWGGVGWGEGVCIILAGDPATDQGRQQQGRERAGHRGRRATGAVSRGQGAGRAPAPARLATPIPHVWGQTAPACPHIRPDIRLPSHPSTHTSCRAPCSSCSWGRTPPARPSAHLPIPRLHSCPPTSCVVPCSSSSWVEPAFMCRRSTF